MNLLPLSAVTWMDAVAYVFSGVAEVLHEYDGIVVNSPSMSMAVPAVCILKEQVPYHRPLKRYEPSPPSSLIFLRDGYSCQYCAKLFAERDLTLDHVIPKARGGRSETTNLVAACSPCNTRKGHNAKIKPIRAPFQPSHAYLANMARQFPITVPHESWNLYLRWDERLVTVKPITSLEEIL